jgi:hypothetical protein
LIVCGCGIGLICCAKKMVSPACHPHTSSSPVSLRGLFLGRILLSPSRPTNHARSPDQNDAHWLQEKFSRRAR